MTQLSQHVKCLCGNGILCSNDSKSNTNTSVRQHAHIAGYFNITGFWDGKLKSKLVDMHKANQNMTISLVPQHDATEQWDGGLLDLFEH